MIDHHALLMLITIHGGFTQILNMLVYVKLFKVFTAIGKKNNTVSNSMILSCLYPRDRGMHRLC